MSNKNILPQPALNNSPPLEGWQAQPDGVVPRLRFPEFLDAGEWEYLNGNKVFDQITNKNHDSDLPILAITQEHGAIPRDKINYHVSVTDESLKSYKVVEIGDFIISLRSFQGGIEYSNYKGICSPAYIILRRIFDSVEQFFKYYFKTDSFIQDLNRDIEGIRDGKMVSYKQFSSIVLPVPTSFEQQKIADCLSSIDLLITTETQKLNTLKAHKKGLMQQLFPAEGETLPKLRFPKFRDAGEWEEKKLSEVFEFRNGLNADKERYGKGHKYISVMDVISGKPITYNSILNSVEITKKELDSFMVEYGDILFQRSSETQEEAGQANVYLDKERPAIFGGFVIRGKKISEYIPLFMNALLASMRVRREIISHSAGSTRYNISQETLTVIVILVPGLKEQQKIADCLSSLDDLITAQTQKIATLKTHKKGLMQQLFPAIDEVKE
jgi:type I restriction enzyme, S subunit